MEEFELVQPSNVERPEPQKDFVVTSIVIVLALLLIGGGTYFFIHQNSIRETSQNQITNTPITQPTENDVSNWKTYTDSDLEVPVKYPPDWSMKGYKNYTGRNWTYIVFPSHQQEGDDVVNIKGRVECEWTSPSLTRCVRTKEVGDVYTFSQYPETLKMFDVFIKQFTTVKDFTVYSIRGDATWQLWQNEERGFEMKYPPGWVVVSNLRTGANFADPINPQHKHISIFWQKDDPQSLILKDNDIKTTDEVYLFNLNQKTKLMSGKNRTTGDEVNISVFKWDEYYIVISTPPEWHFDISHYFTWNHSLIAGVKGVAKASYCSETIPVNPPEGWKSCGEKYLGNLKLTLKNSDGVTVGTDTTLDESDIKGLFQFDNLLPGTYTIYADLPKGIVGDPVTVIVKARAYTEVELKFKESAQ